MKKKLKTQTKVYPKTILLSIAIALVSVFFVVYAVQSFYPEPKYEDYCKESLRPTKFINNSLECESVGGQWEQFFDENSGWCNIDFACNQEYEPARDIYERNIFFINLIVGLALLLTGFFINLKAIGSGLMASGVIMIFYGTVRHWSDLSNGLRTIVLGITLVILITLAYKKLKD